MLNLTREDGKPSLIAWTLRTVAIVAGLSWMASSWLSTAGHDNETLSRLASNISRGANDPLTTGSVEKRAGATKLDPCAVPKR